MFTCILRLKVWQFLHSCEGILCSYSTTGFLNSRTVLSCKGVLLDLRYTVFFLGIPSFLPPGLSLLAKLVAEVMSDVNVSCMAGYLQPACKLTTQHCFSTVPNLAQYCNQTKLSCTCKDSTNLYHRMHVCFLFVSANNC